MRIPADMNRTDLAEQMGAKAVVSITDMLILLGASDQVIQDSRDRQEILEREPWRRKFTPLEPRSNFGFSSVDWSGTRFA